MSIIHLRELGDWLEVADVDNVINNVEYRVIRVIDIIAALLESMPIALLSHHKLSLRRP